jgi:hypothetical protein
MLYPRASSHEVAPMPTLPKHTDVRAHIVMRRVAFVCVLISVALIGARTGAGWSLANTGPAALLGPISASVSAATWCYYDGQVRRRPALRLNLEGVVFVMPVAFPAYCVWSRGVRGVLILMAMVGAACAALVAGLVVGMFLSVLFGH